MEERVGHELELDAGERRALLSRIMRKQAALSVRVAIVFIAILIALPLVNLYAAQIAGAELYGFTLTWMILGVLFYPLTWGLSYIFVKHSERLEADLVNEKSKGEGQA